VSKSGHPAFTSGGVDPSNERFVMGLDSLTKRLRGGLAYLSPRWFSQPVGAVF
jgi:hypothetical protein